MACVPSADGTRAFGLHLQLCWLLQAGLEQKRCELAELADRWVIPTAKLDSGTCDCHSGLAGSRDCFHELLSPSTRHRIRP